MTILEHLAENPDPILAELIDERRRSNASGGKETHWGRRGGTFHKGDEFFKK